MHLGIGDEFTYFECSRCGCLQIQQFPEDLEKYYPSDYYAYRVSGPSIRFPTKGVSALRARIIVKILSRHHFFKKHGFGRWVAERSSVSSAYPYWVRHQKTNLKLRSNSAILDVGCGTGTLLLDLHELGFRNLLGVDPFLKRDISYSSGIKILKRDLSQLSGHFDFVMLHHSFEHMPDPASTLKVLHALVKPRHYLLVRIPVAGSWAWREYGVNWVQLDAPRHFFLHTTDSMKILAKECHFELSEVLYDASGFAHAGSEMYRKNIPLTDRRSPWARSGANHLFSSEAMAHFTNLDAKLNERKEADQAGFYLYRP